MLTDEEKFRVRFYLGFPDLSSLPPSDTTDEDEILLRQRSSELEVRLTNISSYAEAKVKDILTQLDTALADVTSITGRLPFKRIEDITFRDDELSARWEANSSLINQLANILGISLNRQLGPISIGLVAV